MVMKTDLQDLFNYDFPIEDLFNIDFSEIDTWFLQEDEDKVSWENDFHHFSSKSDGVDTIYAGQLPQSDDLENLELSQFIDDSNDIRFQPVNIPVPKKARNKRSRPHGRAWTTPVVQCRKRKSKAKGGPVSGHKCSHFEVQKSPQWRIGPLGPNTLCNACGIRFRSGRLFPEYRPACSPTFSHEMHSNSTQKVLEMRRDRKMTQCS